MRSSRDARGDSEQRGATFTGIVWADPVLAMQDDVVVNAVTFTPGARTHWHRHAVGQVLHVTNGHGVIATRDGDVLPLTPGDVVHIPAGEEHWHGAARRTLVAHVAVSIGPTEWLEPISEEHYEQALAHIE